MLVLVQTSDLGSALLNFGIFLAMLYVATGKVSYVLAGLVLFGGGAAALYNALDRVQAAGHRLARAVDRREGLLHGQRSARVPAELRLVPAREEPLLDRERRLRRDGNPQRHVPDRRRDAADPVPADGLRLLGDRPGTRSRRRRRRAPPLPGARRTDDAGRAHRAGRLLEAACRGARLRLRAADVHHRRRCPPARPADGDHPALRLLRRLEHRLQLRRCSRS